MGHKRLPHPTTLGAEIVDEVLAIKADLKRLQEVARAAGSQVSELAVIDRRVKLVDTLLRDARDHSTNILNVNFDLDPKVAEKMAVAFLARQRQLREAGEELPDDAK